MLFNILKFSKISSTFLIKKQLYNSRMVATFFDKDEYKHTVGIVSNFKYYLK